MDLMRELRKARTSLWLDHPFFGAVAFGMPYEFDTSIPTAATNGERIKFNPDYVKELSDPELIFLLAHECCHPMLGHNYRRGSRDPVKWNRAVDYIVNQLLHDDNIGKMPAGGLYDRSIYAAGKGTAEGIYNVLPDSPNGDGGHALDNCEDSPGTPAEQAEKEATWKVRVAQAAQAARMMGQLSAGAQRLVDEILRPKVDWRDVLHRFLVRVKQDRRTWARPSRRFLPHGLYLPSVTGEAMGELVFAIDCSGSIESRMVNQFAAEMRNAWEDMCPAALHVMYFDSAVCGVDTFTSGDTLEVRPRGSGGTDFAPVFDEIEKRDIEPVAIVFLTDLCCSSFGEQPDAPVLWVTTEPGTAPFGEIVEMRE